MEIEGNKNTNFQIDNPADRDRPLDPLARFHSNKDAIDIKSGNLYLRTKGEMEEGVKANFPNSIFVRPSFFSLPSRKWRTIRRPTR